MFCPYCGSRIEEDSLFCSSCGKKLDFIDDETGSSGEQHRDRERAPEPEAEAKTALEAEPEPMPELEPEAEAEPELEPEPEKEPVQEPEPEPEAEQEPDRGNDTDNLAEHAEANDSEDMADLENEPIGESDEYEDGPEDDTPEDDYAVMGKHAAVSVPGSSDADTETGTIIDLPDADDDESTRTIIELPDASDDEATDTTADLPESADAEAPGATINPPDSTDSETAGTIADSPEPVGDQDAAAEPPLPSVLPATKAVHESYPDVASPTGHKTMIVGAAIALAVVLAIFIVVFVVKPGSAPSGTNTATGSAPSASANAASSASGSAAASQGAGDADSAESLAYEDANIRISLPANFADAGYSWSSNGENEAWLKNKAGTVVARIVWADAASKQEAGKSDTYEIGSVLRGSQPAAALMRVYYLDNQGKLVPVAGKGSNAEGTSAIDIMGISAEELVSWIELHGANGFVAASLDPAKNAANNASASAAPTSVLAEPAKNTAQEAGSGTITEPFWGVWISAFKNPDTANSYAQEATNKGFNGTVFVTTEWSNLNPETWYSVAAGYAHSEAEANTLCERAKAAGYTDAYVKYSGNYQG